MTFLPIVERELRLAARRRSTYRIRWWTALVGLGMSSLAMGFASVGANRSSGVGLFNLLTGLALLMCLLSGVFLTADALGEEAREGTLGLLFLTDLKGYDVVLGKFISLSLNAVYGLLALLPIAGLPLLLGGVTGAEFWRMALVELNALFFSLAAGMLVSALTRHPQRAMLLTLGLLVLLAGGLPGLADLGSRVGLPQAWGRLAWLSPVCPFSYSADVAYAAHARDYFGSLLASQLLGWLFLAAASVILPRIWQEKGRIRFPSRLRALPAGDEQGFRRRAELLSKNPVLWLRNDEIGVQWSAWAVVLGWGAIVAGLILIDYFSGGSVEGSWFSFWIVIPTGFLLKILFAFHACRFFAEARRNGNLELLLCTPLSSREITSGQHGALWRRFRWPIGLFLGLLLTPSLVHGIRANLTANNQATFQELPGLLLAGGYSVRMIADLEAICWFGMAMALTAKRPNFALAYTVLFVLVLPAMLCWLDIAAELVLIAWSISQCQQDLRRLLAAQYLPAYQRANA